LTERCCHCLAVGLGNPCPDCEALMADLGDPDEPPPQPQPAPRPRRTGPFQTSREDDAAYRDLLARRSFEPLNQVKPKAPPSWSKSKWGKAVGTEWRKKPGKIK
jgi:hypothetical protein